MPVGGEPPDEPLVQICGPVVVCCHVRPPSEAEARREAAAMERLLVTAGGRAMFVELLRPTPPPGFAALRHYRRLIQDVAELECVACVVNSSSDFAYTIGANAITQLFRLTRLTEAMSVFPAREPALLWLHNQLDADFDEQAILDLLELMRGRQTSMAQRS